MIERTADIPGDTCSDAHLGQAACLEGSQAAFSCNGQGGSESWKCVFGIHQAEAEPPPVELTFGLSDSITTPLE